jgi:hypothetical protein
MTWGDNMEDCHAPQNYDWMCCRGGDACRASDIARPGDERHGRHAQHGHGQQTGGRAHVQSSRELPTTPLRSLCSPSSLSSLPAPLRTLSSLPAPALVRHSYRRRQLLAVGANAIRLAPAVDLRLSNDGPPRLLLEIDIRQLLTRAVLHDKAGVLFLDSPRRRDRSSGLKGDGPSMAEAARVKGGRTHPLSFNELVGLAETVTA